jgi:16S rRNA (uracil1498-N3)-methyltransferase
MRRRFFVERFESGRAVLVDEAAHHLGRVLRAEPGQQYELSDGNSVWLGRVERVGRDEVEFALVEQVEARTPKLHIRLLLSIIKIDRFEWCLEKATELGVSEIVPLAAARSDKTLVQASAKRSARWQKILVESAQQSRCLRPPQLHPLGRPPAAFRDWQARSGISLLLSERPAALGLRKSLPGKTAVDVTLAFGPAGGWTDEEFSLARDAGYLEASLGVQILRTETAVTAALAIVNYALGD